MQQFDNPPTNKQSFWRRLKTIPRTKLLISGCLGVLLVAAGVWYWYDSQPIISRSLVSEADFSVYAPKKAPVGYKLQDEQVKLSNGLLNYGFIDEINDKHIAVTVQSKPSGFNIEQMSEGGSISSTATPNGTIYNLSAGGASRYLLDAGGTLIYLTSPESIDTSTINQLASSLIKLN